MRDRLWTKGLVLGIIILFLEVSVIPSINGVTNQSKNADIDDYIDVISVPFDDTLDQYMVDINGGMGWADAELYFAQSFIPTLNTLTRVKLCIQRGDEAGYFIFSVRENLYNNDLVTLYKQHDEIPDLADWVEFDFPDIQVNPGSTYYIIIGLSQDYVHYSAGWDMNFDENAYPRGSQFGSGDFGATWQPSVHVNDDYSFMTYGYNRENPLAAEAGGPYVGTSGTPVNLSGSAIGGTPPYNYAWDLDNDSQYDDATGVTPSYTWNAEGTYTIGLKVTDNAIIMSADIAQVTITNENRPVIEIEQIKGGFGISAVIKNNGTGVGTDIAWSIDVSGGIILSGSHTEGTIDELAVGASTTIKAKPRGIGRITITVQAGDAVEEATAFLLGPLVLRVQEL